MNESSVVLFCIDAGYVVPLAVALRSLATATLDAERFTVVVLSVGMPPEHQERLRISAAPLTVQFVEIADRIHEDLPTRHHFTSAIYGRLWAAHSLPPTVTRAVYLDADVLVCHDLGPLFDADLSDSGVAAVQDVGIPHVADPTGLTTWRELGLDPTTPYLNSGVLVIDPERWRTTRLTERVVDHLRADPGRVSLGDQDGLNAVLGGDFAPLPLRWNQLDPLRCTNHLGWSLFPTDEVEQAIADPAIIHLTGAPKPWQHGCDDPAARRWWDTLAETAYCDHRLPPPARRERAIRAIGRTARRLLRA